MSNEGGGRNFHNFTLEFLVSQCRKTSCGKHLFQRKSGTEKQIWISGGGITFFRRKFFCLTSPKKIAGTLQCFRKFLVCKNFLRNEAGGRNFHNFTWKKFSLTVPKKFVGEPFCGSKNWGFEKLMHNRGLHKFLTKFLCLTLPKNFVGNPSVFQKVSGMK